MEVQEPNYDADMEGEGEPIEKVPVDPIEEEYGIWKKNAPFLYDIMFSTNLVWPSLTVDWLPKTMANTQEMLIGTQTSGAEQNYLRLAEVRLPETDENVLMSEWQDSEWDASKKMQRIDVKMKIPHAGDVNRALHNPKNAQMFATKSIQGHVLVYDKTAHPTEPDLNKPVGPQGVLNGLTQEGYALSWDCHGNDVKILSGDSAGDLAYWDIKSPLTKDTAAGRVWKNAHAGGVEDVSCHMLHENRWASVGNDGCLKLWDARKEDCTSSVKAHAGVDVTTVDFNPFLELEKIKFI